MIKQGNGYRSISPNKISSSPNEHYAILLLLRKETVCFSSHLTDETELREGKGLIQDHMAS